VNHSSAQPKPISKRRTRPCPYCGSGDTLPIVYGLIVEPDPSFVPCGCVIEDGQPLRHCHACGRGFDFRDGAGIEASE
jgi:hypothetical protein